MGQKSRVLVFTTAYRPMIGGSEIALEEMVRRLPDIFFDIVTPRYKREVKALEVGDNFNIYRTGIGLGVMDKIFFPVLGFLKANRLAQNNKYNIVHSYQASYGGGAAWVLKTLKPKLSFILTVQEGKQLDDQSLFINWLRAVIIKRADIITVISNYLGDYVKKYTKNKNVFLIPNGVDLSRFVIPESKLQKSLDLQKPNRRVIITVSRLVPKNGLADLITAFHILRSKLSPSDQAVQNLKLVIIGNGPQREELFQLSADLGLKENVEFLGSIPNEEIYDHLSSSSVFVRPSRSEGLGVAFLEAMAAGVPIVAPPVGGIPDFLRDGKTGIFCKVGDPNDIADKINMILSDDNLRERLVLNGRKLVEEKYDWDKIAVQFKKIYGI